MGQGNRKPMTYVANGFHRDIQACVRSNRIEIYEEEMGIEAKVGGSGVPVEAGAAYNNRQKKKYVTQDPGFATIKPGSHFGFAESGVDGRVFVTIQIASDIPHSNVQVHNNSSVLIDKEGSLRNVKDNKIWTDTSGRIHLVGTPANMEVISLARGLLKNADGDPRALAWVKPANRTDAIEDLLCRYRNKGRLKKCFGTKGNAVGQMNHPQGICSTASDDIVVVDTDNHRIQIFDVNGKVKGVFGSNGTSKGQFNSVADVCVTSRGRIVASDKARIQIFDEQGRFIRKFGRYPRGDVNMNKPVGVAADDKGLIYVHAGDRIRVFSEDGNFVRKFGSKILYDAENIMPTSIPHYLSVAPNGRVVVSQPAEKRVLVFDSHSGRLLFEFGTEGTKEGQFNHPFAVATDSLSNMIVCDWDCDCEHGQVQIFTSSGEFLSCFGSFGFDPGQLALPTGVCALSDGQIAVSESGSHRINIF